MAMDCYECKGYGDDYSYDPETDSWVRNCDECYMNTDAEIWEEDDE